MNAPKSKPKLNKQIYQEAAEWLVELRVGDVDPAARERLDAWFRESPHHIRAFLELASIWEDGGDRDLDRLHSTEDLIARARATSNVIPLDQGPSAKGARAKPAQTTRRPSWRPVVAACVVGVGLLGVVGLWIYGRMEPTYTTSVGEERSIRLQDGSSLELNSRSQVRVHFSDHVREVELVGGQALFHVAKDASRPFVVGSGSAQVRAVGTQFDVYRKASGTTITVVEGQVAVVPAPQLAAPDSKPVSETSLEAGDKAIILAAGEQMTVAPAATSKPAKADVAAATAWTQHRLVFESTPLTDVAQEFNRYNVRQLIVNDTALKEFHVTGVFSSTDPSSLLRFLRAQRGISIEETDAEIRILKK